MVFAVAVALDDEPSVLYEGRRKLHAQAAEEEEMAGGMTEADGPGEER